MSNETKGAAVLTVAGQPGHPKFGKVFVGPPAFTTTVQLEAGTRLCATLPAASEGDPHAEHWAALALACERLAGSIDEGAARELRDSIDQLSDAIMGNDDRVDASLAATDERIDELLNTLDGRARAQDGYYYGLPLHDDPMRADLRDAVREWLKGA